MYSSFIYNWLITSVLLFQEFLTTTQNCLACMNWSNHFLLQTTIPWSSFLGIYAGLFFFIKYFSFLFCYFIMFSQNVAIWHPENEFQQFSDCLSCTNPTDSNFNMLWIILIWREHCITFTLVKKLNQYRSSVLLPPQTSFWTKKHDSSHNPLILSSDRVIQYGEDNRMTVQNVAIVFGPTLLRPETESANITMHMVFQNQIVEFILNECERLFYSN